MNKDIVQVDKAIENLRILEHRAVVQSWIAGHHIDNLLKVHPWTTHTIAAAIPGLTSKIVFEHLQTYRQFKSVNDIP